MQRCIVLIAAIIVAAGSLLAQTTMTKHVVERGETLESIAQHYKVTTAKIIEHNPQASQFIYVGMELLIPVDANVALNKQSDVVEPSKPLSTDGGNHMSDFRYSIDMSDDEDYPKWGVAMEMAYGFLAGKGSNHAYEVTIGPTYSFTRNLFLNARIGYNSANYYHAESERGEYANTTTEINILRVPVEIGYKFMEPNKRNVGIIPFAGFGLNIGLSGKQKYKSSQGNGSAKIKKVGGKLGVDCMIGLRLYLWAFTISGGYHIPLNDRQEGWFGDDAYPMVSIGWTM